MTGLVARPDTLTEMSAAENKRLLQQVFSEMEKGNSRPWVEIMADDVRWTVIGTTRWSKTYEGKQSVLTDLLGVLRSRLADRMTMSAHRFIAEDDHVAVEARGRATTKDGRPYNNTYCLICRMAGGKVKELTEYVDTELVTAALDR